MILVVLLEVSHEVSSEVCSTCNHRNKGSLLHYHVVTRQRCTAIAINEGITVDENNMATAEWGSVGQNPVYLCLINGSDGVSC